MKHRFLQKILAAALAITVCVCACPFSAFAAGASPLIYLPDFTELALFYSEGGSMREVFSVSSTAFTKSVTFMIYDFLVTTESPQLGVQRLTADIDGLLYEISCTAEGRSLYPQVSAARNVAAPFSEADNSQVDRDTLQAILAATDGAYTAKDLYIFNYDWRLSPLDNAALLADYIDAVLARTGAKRAALLAGGYGGIVANAYLYSKPDHAAHAVSRCVFLDSFLMGSSLIGDLMNGSFVRTAANKSPTDDPFSILKPDEKTTDAALKEAIAAYATEDPTGVVARAMTNLTDSSYTALYSTLVLSLISSILSGEGTYGRLAAGIKHIATEYDTEVLNHGLRLYLRNTPGLWALVPAESYDDAMAYLFGETQPTDALLEQIEAYRAVQNATAQTLQTAAANGITVAVVAGYNRQILPLTGNLEEQSDSIAATRYAAPGVTTNDVSKDVSLSKTCALKRHKHASPDGLIDASTCFLPEQTWFIKNHRHMDYAEQTAAAFVGWLLTATAPTVHDNEQYPQYQVRSLLNKTLSPYVQGDSPFDFIYGDINNDGFVTAEDARLALRFAVGLEFPTKLMAIAADVDNDDFLTAQDARLILRFAVGLDTEFPVDRL